MLSQQVFARRLPIARPLVLFVCGLTVLFAAVFCWAALPDMYPSIEFRGEHFTAVNYNPWLYATFRVVPMATADTATVNRTVNLYLLTAPSCHYFPVPLHYFDLEPKHWFVFTLNQCVRINDRVSVLVTYQEKRVGALRDDDYREVATEFEAWVTPENVSHLDVFRELSQRCSLLRTVLYAAVRYVLAKRLKANCATQ